MVCVCVGGGGGVKNQLRWDVRDVREPNRAFSPVDSMRFRPRVLSSSYSKSKIVLPLLLLRCRCSTISTLSVLSLARSAAHTTSL